VPALKDLWTMEEDAIENQDRARTKDGLSCAIDTIDVDSKDIPRLIVG
jgi:hypothetical protein